MNFLKKEMTYKKITFFAIFTVLAIFAQKVNFSTLIGADNQFFTLFQFFAPIAGAFLGPVFGITAVLLAEAVHYILRDTPWTVLNMLRLIPMLFATYYFGTRNEKKVGVLVPALAIIIFVMHPVGRTVWFFSLYWMIPIVIRMFPKRFGNSLFLKSLGSTFTAHAVGGALWIWSVPMTTVQWVGLIPVVAYERLLFAGGIALSYVIINTLLDRLDEKLTSGAVSIEKKYSFARWLFAKNN